MLRHASIAALSGIALFGLTACGAGQAQRSDRSGVLSSGSIQALGTSPTQHSGSAVSASTGGAVEVQGFDGSNVWQLKKSSIDMSSDGGTNWTSVPLPAVTSISDIAITPSGEVWLTASNGTATGLDLWGKKNARSSWTKVALSPSWPSLEATQPPPRGVISVGTAPISVLLERGGADVGVSSNLFVQSGSTFVQRPLPSRSVVFGSGTVIFINSHDAVAQDDGEDRKIYYSSDGGQTWSGSDINNQRFQETEIGTPVADGQNIYLLLALTKAQATPSSLGSSIMALYVSTDGGATYHSVDSSIGVASGPSALPVIAASGNNIWLAPFNQNLLYESTDGGNTWTRVVPTGFFANPGSMTLLDSINALSLGATTSCTAFKQNCVNRPYLLRTTDGGRTWKAIEGIN
ncbi:MAG: exo-alpha-sialidase [Acidimicrobiaceae bacterium]|nr:exo-alpha-sialidase [Acidimicrobiaceae bacterium]